MIKSFTATTNEIDDIDAAVSGLLAQLDMEGKNKLLAHSVGLISCFYDYVEYGVWQALCDALPFDVIGSTTIANAAAGNYGNTMLTLTVLTSDDVSFATAVSGPVDAEDKAPIKKLYDEAAARLPGKPSLILSFVPLLTSFGSDFYVDCMTEISGNVPNFGTLAVDHNPDYHDSMVLLNAGAWRDRFALLLFHGPIEPTFYIGTISDEKMFQEKGVVTASQGNQLQTVNGISMTDYLLSLGLTKNEEGTIAGINTFPIIVDYNDGTMPVVRAMFALTPEGYAVCGGNIPVGSTLSIGNFDAEEIVATTARTLETALANKHDTMLIYSCIGRFFSQGYDSMAELGKLQKLMEGTDTVYMAAYSGGELCPVYTRDGDTINRNHNNSFVICAL
jgi:hypothetical protein